MKLQALKLQLFMYNYKEYCITQYIYILIAIEFRRTRCTQGRIQDLQIEGAQKIMITKYTPLAAGVQEVLSRNRPRPRLPW